jgi:hypothetical protein
MAVYGNRTPRTRPPRAGAEYGRNGRCDPTVEAKGTRSATSFIGYHGRGADRTPDAAATPEVVRVRQGLCLSRISRADSRKPASRASDTYLSKRVWYLFPVRIATPIGAAVSKVWRPSVAHIGPIDHLGDMRLCGNAFTATAWPRGRIQNATIQFRPAQTCDFKTSHAFPPGFGASSQGITLLTRRHRSTFTARLTVKSIGFPRAVFYASTMMRNTERAHPLSPDAARQRG